MYSSKHTLKITTCRQAQGATTSYEHQSRNRRSDQFTNPADLPPLDETAKVPRDKQDDVVPPSIYKKRWTCPVLKNMIQERWVKPAVVITGLGLATNASFLGLLITAELRQQNLKKRTQLLALILLNKQTPKMLTQFKKKL